MASTLGYLTIFGSAALLLGACVIKSTTSSDDDTHTTTTHTTSQGAGGSVPTGGYGGTGGEIPTGGNTSCVDAIGTGITVAACDNMNITPQDHGGLAAWCGPNYDQDGPGYLVCVRGFAIYTDGQAEDLQACLAQIGVEDACTDSLAIACVDQMYNDACTQQDVIDFCDGIATTCSPDPFDAGQCASDLNPFGQAGLSEIADCMNTADPGLTCQEAYDQCFQSVATVTA